MTIELDPATLNAPTVRVVVAGYTGRNEAAVRHHIDELARIGVAPPENVPEFYPMPSGTLSFGETTAVTGTQTSGEVEPVLIRLAGRYYLTVGSDHTDREHEAISIAESKQRCPKPLSATALPVELGQLESAWDSIQLTTTVDGVAYQSGSAAALRPLTETLRLLQQREGLDGGEDLVLFGGTVPLLTGDFQYGTHWELALRTPEASLGLTYRTAVTAPEGAAHAQG
ncbi:DUF2848 family protein [Ruania alba]|uniref:DUF2848 domain-containing protein n=1 Tax=Ruania alba TaxID=648782 RepID=A0A1H5GVY5_9MICO|nr:DUF2848 family protein [Ruania alba]SEE19889.1 Protein of unknown function [Ruania alba]